MKRRTATRHIFNSISFVIVALTLAPLFQNCSAGFGIDEKLVSLSSLSSAGVERFATAQKVMNSSCFSCHSSGGSASTYPLNFSNEQQFITAGLVVPGKPAESKLIARLRNFSSAAAANMPPSGPLASADYQAIYNWILRMGEKDGPYACSSDDPQSNIVSNHGKRLSARQYRNTVSDLVSRFLGASEALAFTSQILTVTTQPQDSTRYKRWDNSSSGQHFKHYFEVANAFAQKAETDLAFRDLLVKKFVSFDPGSCTAVDANNLSDACKQQFVRNFGLRTFRRPLRETATENEFAAFMSEFSGVSSAVGTGQVVFRAMMSPTFLSHLEEVDSPTSNPVIFKLSSYGIINRLSYTFWNSMPDEQLLTLAKTRDLSVLSEYQVALDHVFANSRLASSVKEFFSDWLQLDHLPNLDSTSKAGAVHSAGYTIDNSVRDQMVSEVQDLGVFIAETGGTFPDLFTTDISFAKTPELKQLYGVTENQQLPMTLQNAVRLPAGTRSGLLTRAALLLHGKGDGTANPIVRGVRVRHEILCLPDGNPPDNFAEVAAAAPIHQSMTLRQRTESQTSGAACITCHSKINPIGFALGNYNGFGIYKTTEPLFDAQGNFTNQTATIDPKVDLSAVIGPGAYADNPIQFSETIAERPETRKCFSEHFSKFVLARSPNYVKDGCRLNRLYEAASSNTSLKNLMQALALDPEFRLRKITVEAQ